MSSTSTIPEPQAPIPRWRRIRAWAIVCILYGFVLALAASGFVILRHAFASGLDITDRLYRLIGAAVVLAFPVLVASYLIRAKWTTGRWSYPWEHTLQRFGQCAIHAQGRIRPQQRSLVLFVLHWANIALRDPQSTVLKRSLGVLVLIVYAAALVAICALTTILVGAGIATFASFGWIMVLFGLILLIIPAQFIAATFHRFRTHGDLRSSQDDLTGIMAARRQWFQQQRQQSLSAKLISSLIMLAVLTAWWLRVTVYHSRHPHESWLLPLFWTLPAIYLIWNQFRGQRAHR